MIPRSVLLNGSRAEEAEPRLLRAGPLALEFADGALRYIRLSEREIVRRVYCAVRDADWATVPNRISNLREEVGEDSFRIEFNVENVQAEIDFAWHGTITGEANGRIIFEMNGIARRAFRKNRIGFCVLHPMECAGTPVEIRHADGSTERSEFPQYIAPHNPFLEVVELKHQVLPGIDVELSFEGDVFETEDQRNWLDASFKTFCTPLSRPFPVEVHAGERIVQWVVTELHAKAPIPTTRTSSQQERVIHLEPASQPIGPLPQLGYGIDVDAAPLTPTQIQRLRLLKPAHLRCEVRLSSDYEPALRRAARAADDLNSALDLALFIGPDVHGELSKLIELIGHLKPPIARWIVFPGKGWSTTLELAEAASTYLRGHDPRLPIGGGTPADFCELNRQRPPSDLLDFVTWSLNPQVHAYDNASLVETLAAHVATIEAARRFSGGLPLVVGPVTLKMRVNPYATGPWPPPLPAGTLPIQVDPRQMSLFGAGWTLGSIKYLAESGIHAATYYELVGWKGLVEREAGSPLPELFPSPPDCVFPMYHIFADVAELSDAQVVPVRSSDPFRVEALMLKSGPLTRLVAANLSGRTQAVSLPAQPTSARVRLLDERNAVTAMTSPEAYRTAEVRMQPIIGGQVTVDLLPYAIARVDLI